MIIPPSFIQHLAGWPVISGAALTSRVERLLTKGVRNNLIAKGLARTLVWKDGELPPQSPKFPTELTADLLDYGYTLLRLCLLLREQQGDSDLATNGFERSAEAIESVIRRGSSSNVESGFHAVVAACAYHLGHFSARSYCLLPMRVDLNLAPAEYALFCLLRRSLDDLGTFSRQWLQSELNSDESVATRLENPEDEMGVEAALDNAITAGLLRALSTFDFALLTGSPAFVEEAVELFQECESISSELNQVPSWWISKLAKHLVSDLWAYSLHSQLPQNIDGDGGPQWTHLRNLFIAHLRSKRNTAEIELWPSQIAAASRSIDTSDDLVVSLPTSAGKTRIAELCILRTLASERRVVYVTPLRALSAQVERDLRETFQPLGFTVSSLYGAAGAVGTDVDTLGNRSIVVATPEKLDFAVRQEPELLNDVGLIVLDEAHMIGPEEREVRYEVLVQRLLRRTDASTRRIVCLSAILPRGEQLTDFVAWIRQGGEGDAVLSEWRPTRQRFGTISWKGSHARLEFSADGEDAFVERYVESVVPTGRRRKHFPADVQELTLAAAWKIVAEGGSALIFCPQRRSVGALAKKVLQLHKQGLLKPLVSPSPEVARAKRIAVEWLSENHPAVQCLDIGVAVHHAGLPKPFLREIERLLRARRLPVIISSPTLAQGLNLSAASLLMYSLRRGEELIRGEEFANIIGRAGRARIDIEGQVLYVMFEPSAWRLHDWRGLVSAARHRSIQSGLAILIALITEKLARALHLEGDHLAEYVLNNTNVWEEAVSADSMDSTADGERSLEQEVAFLDAAILALIEDHDVDIQMLPAAFDAILTDSLWVRTLARQPDSVRELQKRVLHNRARYIWENSTGVQRRGYFAAGVSFRTGRRLDEAADVLNDLLFRAETAIAQGQFGEAIRAVVEFSEIVFTIPPFAPDELPAQWKTILRMWLNGEPMSAIVPLAPEDAVEFIEDDVVYRLVWGAEAVRVRSVAHNDEFAELWTGQVAESIEAGTMLRPATVLLQAGLGSRAAALAALNDLTGDFVDYDGMRQWIRSEPVREASRNATWPTPETADLWRRFALSVSDEALHEWKQQQSIRSVLWDSESASPAEGSMVRLVNPVAGPRTDVCGPDFQRFGRLQPSLPTLEGLVYGVVNKGGKSITVNYLGPSELK